MHISQNLMMMMITVATNTFAVVALNFRDCMLLKGAVML